MYSNREQNNDYMVDYKQPIGYEHEEYTARNEYASEPVNNQLDDLDSLLYYTPQSNQATKTIPAPKAYAIDETDDAMPSMTTMQFRSNADAPHKGELPIDRNIFLYEADRVREEDKQYKINAKGKVLIAVYAIVVLTIFALIVINTRLLNNMNNNVAMMEYRLQELQTQQVELNEELDFVSSDAEIEKKALELGMTK